MATNRRIALRLSLTALAGIALISGAGFAFRRPWAIALWPAAAGPLSYVFVASVLAAFAAAALFIAVTDDLGGIVAVAVTPVVALAGGGLSVMASGAEVKAVYGAAFLGLAVGALPVWFIGMRLPARDKRPLPTLARISFAVFVAALLLTGGALAMGQNVLPWPVDGVTGRLIGWIFLGDAGFFVYGLLRPTWANGYPQLLAFLAYDIVIFPPLVGRVSTVPREMVLSLTLYLAVILYSGLLAIGYLVLNPATRLRFRPRDKPAGLAST